MLAFVKSQWPEMTRFLPGADLLDQPSTAESLAARAVGGGPPGSLASFLVWGTVANLPVEIKKTIKPQTLIKQDAFLAVVEGEVGRNCYTLSQNCGSRPQPSDAIRGYIRQQRRFAKFENLDPVATFALAVEDFPESGGGRRHVTTAKNVLYLFDSWRSLYGCLVQAYPRLKALESQVPADRPVMLYVSNSIKPGRIFGDPFTGQLAAYAFIFGRDNIAPRSVIAYYPHQVHNQLFDGLGNFNKNKGITLMREVVDYAFFHGGVAVNMKTGAVI